MKCFLANMKPVSRLTFLPSIPIKMINKMPYIFLVYLPIIDFRICFLKCDLKNICLFQKNFLIFPYIHTYYFPYIYGLFWGECSLDLSMNIMLQQHVNVKKLIFQSTSHMQFFGVLNWSLLSCNFELHWAVMDVPF